MKAAAVGVAGLGAATQPSSAAEVQRTPPNGLRVLILGGTGFTGPHQVRYALARGHSVTIFNRGRQKKEWPGEVEELLGDRNTGDLKSLEGREWDVCIDNPTTLPFWVRDAGKTLRGKVQQYVFISTVSVYAAADKPDDESAAMLPYEGADPMAETADTLRAKMQLYGQLKAASEAEAKRVFGAKATIIRPGLIVGPGDETDRFTYWPVRLARGGEVLAPGDGNDPVQFIDARDLAEWTIRMAETRTTGTFNATGPATRLVMRDMLAGIAAATKADARLTWVPADFLEKQQVSEWTDLPVWIPGQG
ncbi:MAG TPA: NAD-dependent epimerase/dehydratase family protein, partial [Caldimonas sp.]